MKYNLIKEKIKKIVRHGMQELKLLLTVTKCIYFLKD